jgi:hypothetical protein
MPEVSPKAAKLFAEGYAHDNFALELLAGREPRISGPLPEKAKMSDSKAELLFGEV